MKILKDLIRKEIRKILHEGSEAHLYKIDGLLVTTAQNKTQSQIFSDIRAITGVTTLDVESYIPNLPKKNQEYNKVILKIDPNPYIKSKGKFDLEDLKAIIKAINDIKGVVKFVVKDPQLINIGI